MVAFVWELVTQAIPFFCLFVITRISPHTRVPLCSALPSYSPHFLISFSRFSRKRSETQTKRKKRET